ncbi:MAG: MFS transporter [Deltaproteobacteria bacterium]|nr:MAG: MFS transporter [Deltaproteobacteria bacterium]
MSAAAGTAGGLRPARSLAAALLGFFIITLDALVVSVALPAIRDTLGGGLTGLQWVVDGYTLPFAATLLLAGTLSDRFGARRAYGLGIIVFTASSAACALSPSLEALIAARFVQGAGAALMTPASLALIGEAFPEPAAKARAIGLWAVGGAIASASGPLVGGALTRFGWPLIFLVNLPIGAVALWLLTGVPRSRRRPSTFDWPGQALALVGLTAMTYGLIAAGDVGFTTLVLAAFAVALAAAIAFFVLQTRRREPMVPLALFRPRAAATTIAIGFSFMVGFYGMVFMVSLFLQEKRGMTPLETGLAFVPVTALSVFMPVLAARLAERFGPWVPIAAGQAAMALGLFALSAFASTVSVPVLVALMVPVGVGAGTAMPSATSLLLNTVPGEWSGTASGVLNTTRQVGGALAIAGFGALIAGLDYERGMAVSLAVAGALLTATLVASLRLRSV